MGIEEKRTQRGRERCERRRRFCRHGPASPPSFITTAIAELCHVIVKVQMLWWFEIHRRLSSLPLFPSFTLPTFMEEASSLKNAAEQRKRMQWVPELLPSELQPLDKKRCYYPELAGECRRNSVCPRFLISFVYLAVVISAFTLTIYFRVSSSGVEATYNVIVLAVAMNKWAKVHSVAS
ncbi:hypothetical protein PIB30_066432 [Stylosanthes scabra]|uniref:Uncharacterized protein n=1 Tax=Stylosanthes scabra TaxID=79078 RepID=A0ABU6WM35_9FABA|nr:hypothetical protein [Stylosanthes scabra]